MNLSASYTTAQRQVIKQRRASLRARLREYRAEGCRIGVSAMKAELKAASTTLRALS